MNIKEQKTELNKTDIYENVRKDINRRQTVHSNKSANYRSGTPEMPDRRKKVYSSYDHYYHNDSNTARMPTHNHHLYLKRLLEYHNTEHDYKVLQVKQRMKEENEMLQNEMTRLREVRKNHEGKGQYIGSVNLCQTGFGIEGCLICKTKQEPQRLTSTNTWIWSKSFDIFEQQLGRVWTWTYT